jgi:predicted nucleotidyltransferase
MSKVNNEIMKMLKSAVEMCASKYNFDSEEAYRMICECEGLEVKKRNNKKVSDKVKAVKSLFPLPYNGELNSECCFGIRLNSGLYTQCPSVRPEGGAYCKSCDNQAAKNEHGLPDYGNIQNRLSKYTKDEEFVDPSGKKPVAYTKIMKKFKVTEEQVREEAAKHNMTLDPRHFEEKVVKKSGRPAKVVTEQEPKEVKSKGRPKKSKKVLELAGEEEDLFASLVMSSLVPSAASKNIKEDVIVETVTSEVISVAESDADDNSSLGDVDVVVDAKPKKEKKPKIVVEQKKLEAEQNKVALAEQKKLEAEQKKQALAEQKAAEKLALAEQKKAEAEQKKQALAEQKKAEAEQKKLALEKEKEAKKFLKELEKQEKQAAAEIKKENKKENKKDNKKSKVDDDDRPSPAFVEPPEEADVVKKIVFEGKKYLKSKNTGIIYNMEQDVIGKWNEEKNRIDFDETGEESEEEYDEDM